jgi:hypothetical protein
VRAEITTAACYEEFQVSSSKFQVPSPSLKSVIQALRNRAWVIVRPKNLKLETNFESHLVEPAQRFPFTNRDQDVAASITCRPTD